MMSYDELNRFIENYLVNDKSQRALMLTAQWGTGKSFYVKNELCPYLTKNNKKYSIISLYGITSIKDISKNIYLEIRTKGILDKGEKTTASWMLGKTVVKGIASFINVDLNQNEEDLERLYKSIDLSNRLIILEDLERTNLDIVEVLGFVNNLVEQDGVKVLIVANEEEILKYEENTGDNKTKELTINSKEYLKIKEKTIGDTIQFQPNYIESITNVIKSFNNQIFDELLKPSEKNGDSLLSLKINQELSLLNSFNLRSVLFACQKMDDILRIFEHNLNLKFVEGLFIGTIVYSAKTKTGNKLLWDNQSFTSQKLGSFKYPLYKPMYDYIEGHRIDKNNFDIAQSIFIKNQNISDADSKLKIIYGYYVSNNHELEQSLNYVLDKLKKDDEVIIHDQYVRIANYLIAIKFQVGFENIIDKCLSLMLINAKKCIDKGVRINTSVTTGIQLMNDEQNEVFNKFINVIESYQNKGNIVADIIYKPDKWHEFYETLINKQQKFNDGYGFLCNLDVSVLIIKLKQSNSQQIYDFRGIIQHIYLSFSNTKDFFLCDLPSLKELVNQLDKINFEEEKIDKIQKLQLNWLKDNLNEVIERLEG